MAEITLGSILQWIMLYLVFGFFYASFVLEVWEHAPDYELVRVKKHLVRTRTRHQVIFLGKRTIGWPWYLGKHLWRAYRRFKDRIVEY